MKLFGHEISKKTLIELIKYAIVGVGTTLTNFITYLILSRWLNVPMNIANGLGWFTAVLFTFFADKNFVFKTKRESFGRFLMEMFHFIAMRLASGVIEISGFFIFVTLLGFNDLLVKAGTGVVVVVINYLVSKFIIFAEKNKPIEKIK